MAGYTQKLTPAQVDRIIRLYDDGFSYREIEAETGHDYKTVGKYVRAEQQRRGKAYLKERDQRLGQLVDKLFRNLDELDSKTDYNAADFVKAKAEQRQTAAQIAKLIGLDQPQKVEHSGTLDVRSIQWVEEVVDPAGDTSEQT